MKWSILSVILVIAFAPGAFGDPFSDAGLVPVVCRFDPHGPVSTKETADILKSAGARALHVFPGGVIFGRMPEGIEAAVAAGSGFSFYRSKEGLRAACAGLDPVVLEAAGNLLEGEEYKRCLMEKAPDIDRMQLDSRIKEHPPQQDIEAVIAGPGPAQTFGGERLWAYQNSEFLIGSVLINIVFPQGSSLEEYWTEEEFSEVVSSISIGLSELQQYTHWVDLDFYYNYSDFKWVPVDTEPCMTHWYDHEDWITEALTSLGYPGKDSYLGTFALNNDARAEFGTDWVFTAYIADMSDHWDPEMTYYDPRCWGGWSEEHDSRSPVSYAMIGGPYLVVSHPACWLDYGVGFYRVFLHEMFHIFWAWDEYCGESCCYVRMGYFDILNWNVCGPAEPCVMQGVRYGPQLCLCGYTMRQMGLVDENENSIPDVFDIPPTIEFIDYPGNMSDTIYVDEYILSARGVNPKVPNMNPFQKERIPGDMIDYGATIAKGLYRINSGLAVDIFPSDSKWDESREDIGTFISGFDPGINTFELELENCVGRKVTRRKDVYFVGLKYYSFSVNAEVGSIDLNWLTASEVFGAEFEVSRLDLYSGTGFIPVDTVSVPDEISYNRRAYSYSDDSVVPGRDYRYRLTARFGFFDGTVTRQFEVASGELDCRAPFSVCGECLSDICPNPSCGEVRFTVLVPSSYSEVGGNHDLRRSAGAASAIGEVKTPVEITVYDVSGRSVRTLFNLERFGGLLTLNWDCRDRNGVPVSPGVYFIKAKVGTLNDSRKVVVLR